MEHLINYPIEVEVIDECLIDNSIPLEFMYNRSFEKNSYVLVHINDMVFHGVCINCERYSGCYMIKVLVSESFKLRMVEQIIRIQESGLPAEEWVSKYASDFPEF